MSGVLNPETFLDLVQRLHRESSIQGDPPDLLSDAVGVNYRLFIWINQAWSWLQGINPDWHFMHRTDLSFPTVAGQMIYTPTQALVPEGNVSSWKKRTFRMYPTVTGQSAEIDMTYWAYDEFYASFMRGPLRTSQRPPYNFTIDPLLNIVLECPADGYTITGEYYRAPLSMAVETDTPVGLEVADRMILVYKAMEWYANDEASPEVLATSKELKRILNRLNIRRLTSVMAS